MALGRREDRGRSVGEASREGKGWADRLPRCPLPRLPACAARQQRAGMRPGLAPTLVPSWRMMMPPAFTGCPPYTLTPRRLDTESRPSAKGGEGESKRRDTLNSPACAARRLHGDCACPASSTVPAASGGRPGRCGSPAERAASNAWAHAAMPWLPLLAAARALLLLTLGGAGTLLVGSLNRERSQRRRNAQAGALLQLLAAQEAAAAQLAAGKGGCQHGAAMWLGPARRRTRAEAG